MGMEEPLVRRVELVVADAAADTRLDAWVAGAVADLGRNHAKRLILAGHVTIDGRTIVEAKRPVKPGETVVIALPAPTKAEPEGEAIALAVVYEDDDLI